VAVPHGDAAHTAGRAALLGAALASRSPSLFAVAFDDRLHEPYRAADAPLLAAIRENPPPHVLGTTLSGSGPTVMVWAERSHGAACAEALAGALEDVDVLPLAVSPTGATATSTG
jgi:homoserine kinase